MGPLAEARCVAHLAGACKRPVRRKPRRSGSRNEAGSGPPVTPAIRRIPCTAASHLTRAATAAVPLPRTGGPRVQPIATRPCRSGAPWVPDRRGAAYQRGARGGGNPRSRILTCGTADAHGGLARGPARWRGGFHRSASTAPGWCAWVASWSWSRRIRGRGSPVPPLPGSMRTHPGGCRRWAVQARPGKPRWGGCMSCWCASRGGRSPGVARA